MRIAGWPAIPVKAIFEIVLRIIPSFSSRSANRAAGRAGTRAGGPTVNHGDLRLVFSDSPTRCPATGCVELLSAAGAPPAEGPACSSLKLFREGPAAVFVIDCRADGPGTGPAIFWTMFPGAPRVPFLRTRTGPPRRLFCRVERAERVRKASRAGVSAIPSGRREHFTFLGASLSWTGFQRLRRLKIGH